MLNPISAVYNAFLAFLQCLPQPIYALMLLIMGCFIIIGIIKVILS